MKGFVNSLRKVTPAVKKYEQRRDIIKQMDETREFKQFLDQEQEKKFERKKKALTSMMNYKELR